MALPPCPPSHRDLPGISFSPPPPQTRDLQAWQVQTTPGTQLPGARASPPYPGAFFPLFLPPPSPIRIVCLNSTLTNMDSSGLGPAVITARPPLPGSRTNPPNLLGVLSGSPEEGGGAASAAIYTALPPRPRAPGTRSLPRKGPTQGQ